jgi:hypothetical protein
MLPMMMHDTQDKDTSKYNRSLAQALDSIQAKSAYVEVRVCARMLGSD